MGCGVSKSEAEQSRVVTPAKNGHLRRNSEAEKPTSASQRAPAKRTTANGSAVAPSKPSQAVAGRGPLAPDRKIGEILTFKTWLESAFPATNVGGSDVAQEPLPDYYTEWRRDFENVDATPDQLGQTVTLTKKAPSHDGPKAKSAGWPYRKPKIGVYAPASPDAPVVDVRPPPGSRKRRVLVIGNCYVGSCAWTERSLAALAGRLRQLAAAAADELHSLVLLGNVFDSRVDRPDVAPSTAEQLESLWRRRGGEALALVRRLADECDVRVYYVRGAHDASVSKSLVERLFGPSVEVVAGGELVLAVHEPPETYRIRFCSGHEYDILESGGGGGSDDELLLGKPIANYLYRAAAVAAGAGARGGSGSSLGYTPLSAVHAFLEDVPRSVNERMIGLLSTRTAQRVITAHLLTHAFGARSIEDVRKLRYVVEDGKFVSAETILNYPYLKYKLNKWPPGELAGLLQANGGDYRAAAKRCQEDVIVYGHSNAWSVGSCRSNVGREVIYAVLGGCSERAEDLTVLSIVPPRLGFNGKVEIICDEDTLSAADGEADASFAEQSAAKERSGLQAVQPLPTEIRIESVD